MSGWQKWQIGMFSMGIIIRVDMVVINIQERACQAKAPEVRRLALTSPRTYAKYSAPPVTSKPPIPLIRFWIFNCGFLILNILEGWRCSFASATASSLSACQTKAPENCSASCYSDVFYILILHYTPIHLT